MREIKFRVWNTLLKEYVPEDIVYLSPDGSPLFGSIMMNDAIYIKRNFQKYKDVILEGENIVEQYTGLKDKNGTEIYEHDICSFISKTGKHTGVVERLDNLAGFGLRMVKNNFRYTFSNLDTLGVNLDTLKVIGNIHEDVELLKETLT